MKLGASLVSLIALAAYQLFSEPPQRVEFCTVVENPAAFASKTVIVRARLTELKHGEWGLDSECFRPVLLVFPNDVRPTPNYELENTEGVRMMLQARRERRVLFRGDFIGRIDLAEPGLQVRGNRTVTFGKSRMNMRLVLHDVQNPERIVIPRK